MSADRLDQLTFPPLPRAEWAGRWPRWKADLDYRDRFRGCLLAVAAGDALGRPFEGRARQALSGRLTRPLSFQKWRGWTGGPVGTVTDDTQLTMLVAESLIAMSALDPADLAARLPGWLLVARGIGTATRTAVQRLAGGTDWSESGENSDGNGAAMRVAPVGLVYSTNPDMLRRSAVLSSRPTHTGRTGLVGTVTQAFAVALALHTPPGSLDPAAFIEDVVAAIADLDDPGVVERRPDRKRVRMVEQLNKIKGMLDWAPDDVFDEFYNGALITESLPSAMWCFLASPDDPERVIETAVSGGRDADTVAAMAGALAGVYNGESALPARWLGDLEYADDLRALADGLLHLNDHSDKLPSAPAGRTRSVEGIDRFVGCLLGGAVGDALGAPIEFASISDIRRDHGSDGVTGYEPAYGRRGAITDDTQMTLFTAEGFLRSEQRSRDRGICNFDAVMLRAYQRWLSTQVDPARVPWDPEFGDGRDSGWLVHQAFLRHRRAPGNTCMSALLTPGGAAISRSINNSKGCGGVMRVAPLGLVAADPFDAACRAAALTHGHPSGWISAGALAEMIARLRHGATLPEAVDAGLARAVAHPKGSEVTAALQAAIDLAASPDPVTPETVGSLGGGWVGEEALAIAVYCALTATAFTDGVLAAVNHSGDSDSTGSITGNLLGAAFGTQAIPPHLLTDLEGADVITRVATDLYNALILHDKIDPDRYPTW
jgi:ADP-ribosylglycohydrolase